VKETAVEAAFVQYRLERGWDVTTANDDYTDIAAADTDQAPQFGHHRPYRSCRPVRGSNPGLAPTVVMILVAIPQLLRQRR
jgi:hypothetical protein